MEKHKLTKMKNGRRNVSWVTENKGCFIQHFIE